MRPFLAIALSLASAQLGACIADGDSCKYDSQEISMKAVATENGSFVRVEVDFEAGDRSSFARPLELCQDDDLEINGESPTKTVKLERVVYSITEPIDDSSRRYRVRFDRESEDAAMETVIELPAPFEILDPEGGASVSRGQPMAIAWEPVEAGARLRVELEEEIGGGVCLKTPDAELDLKGAGVWIDDTGTWTLPAGAVTSSTPARCRASLLLYRTSQASYPDRLGPGGAAGGATLRTVDFTSEP